MISGACDYAMYVGFWQHDSERISRQMPGDYRIFKRATMILVCAKTFCLVARIVAIHYLPVFGEPGKAHVCTFGIGNPHLIGLP